MSVEKQELDLFRVELKALDQAYSNYDERAKLDEEFSCDDAAASILRILYSCDRIRARVCEELPAIRPRPELSDIAARQDRVLAEAERLASKLKGDDVSVKTEEALHEAREMGDYFKWELSQEVEKNVAIQRENVWLKRRCEEAEGVTHAAGLNFPNMLATYWRDDARPTRFLKRRIRKAGYRLVPLETEVDETQRTLGKSSAECARDPLLHPQMPTRPVEKPFGQAPPQLVTELEKVKFPMWIDKAIFAKDVFEACKEGKEAMARAGLKVTYLDAFKFAECGVFDKCFFKRLQEPEGGICSSPDFDGCGVHRDEDKCCRLRVIEGGWKLDVLSKISIDRTIQYTM